MAIATPALCRPATRAERSGTMRKAGTGTAGSSGGRPPGRRAPARDPPRSGGTESAMPKAPAVAPAQDRQSRVPGREIAAEATGAIFGLGCLISLSPTPGVRCRANLGPLRGYPKRNPLPRTPSPGQCKAMPSVLRSRHSALWAVAPHPVAAKPLPTGALHLVPAAPGAKALCLVTKNLPTASPFACPLPCPRPGEVLPAEVSSYANAILR
jgi:hypothetical protein